MDGGDEESISSANAQRAWAWQQFTGEFPVSVWALDPADGSVVRRWTCPEAAAIAGYSAQEFEDDPRLWLDIVHPGDRDRVTSTIRELINGRPCLQEYRIYRSDGQMRWVRDSCVPRHMDEAGLVYAVSIIQDTTEATMTTRREARRSARMAALADISQLFISSLDFDKILGITAEKTAAVLDCLCSISVIEVDTGVLRRAALTHANPDALAQAAGILSQSRINIRDSYPDGDIKPRLFDDLAELLPDAARPLRRIGLRTGVAAPVMGEGRPTYLIACGRFEWQEPFDEDDLWFLTQIASHASSALRSALLYRRQADIAETLQRSLIPLSPEIKCLDIATRYQPSRGEAEVGGDFFDILPGPKCLVGVVVGDVSGKGLQAAIYTAQTKYMLRSYALQSRDPGSVLTMLNRALLAYTDEVTFVSLFYALIDIPLRRMTYVSAGHEPPILLDCADRTAQELAPSGPVLGVVEGVQYETQAAQLASNDLLFIYTDGLVDVPGPGGMFGHERLTQTLRECPWDRPQGILDHVTSVIYDYGHGRQPDDQVVVVLRVRR